MVTSGKKVHPPCAHMGLSSHGLKWCNSAIDAGPSLDLKGLQPWFVLPVGAMGMCEGLPNYLVHTRLRPVSTGTKKTQEPKPEALNASFSSCTDQL